MHMEEFTDTQLAKISQAQQILALLFYEPSLTVERACEMVGISVRQYRYWLSHGGDAINSTRDLIDKQQRELISDIAIAKGKIIQMLIQDALNPLTKPLERKSILEALDVILNEYQTIYNVRPGIEEEAQAFLKQGPKISKKESRFASIDVEETDSGFRIGLNENQKIIDVDTK